MRGDRVAVLGRRIAVVEHADETGVEALLNKTILRMRSNDIAWNCRTCGRERVRLRVSNKEGSEPCRSLADFLAPKETGRPDHIGAFAVTGGIGLELDSRDWAKAKKLAKSLADSWSLIEPADAAGDVESATASGSELPVLTDTS